MTNSWRKARIRYRTYELEYLVSDQRDFVEAYEEFSKSHGTEDLNIDSDKVFRNSRDESAGRDVSL